MATVNQRTKHAVSVTVNGITAGGFMSLNIRKGFDEIVRSDPDGAAVPFVDRSTQFCRGSGLTDDWVHIIELLTGAATNLICYEAESGAATYIKHTVVAPVVHNVRLSVRQGGYATCSFDFECKAADDTKGFADMHTLLRAQVEPAYVTSARGGWRIVSLTHGALSILHCTAIDLAIAAVMTKASNDSDVAYTAVDVEADGLSVTGSVSAQDTGANATTDLASQLLAASRAALVAVLSSSQGAANKTLTIAGVVFGGGDHSSASRQPYSAQTHSFEVCNDATTPLTLSGTNKIVTIA